MTKAFQQHAGEDSPLKRSSAVLGVMLALMAAASAQELVTNGGFETGDLSGWTQWGDTSYTNVQNYTVHSGSYALRSGPGTADGGIQQTLTAPAGTFHVSVWWYTYPGGHMFVKLDGNQIFYDDSNNPPNHYTEFQGDFAAGANPVLQLGFYNPPQYYYVDDVSVTAVGGPTVCRGDLNCDGQINFSDINPFVQALSDYAGWRAAYPNCPEGNADVNGDGQVNFDDINPFVALMSQQPPPTCP